MRKARIHRNRVTVKSLLPDGYQNGFHNHTSSYTIATTRAIVCQLGCAYGLTMRIVYRVYSPHHIGNTHLPTQVGRSRFVCFFISFIVTASYGFSSRQKPYAYSSFSFERLPYCGGDTSTDNEELFKVVLGSRMIFKMISRSFGRKIKLTRTHHGDRDKIW